MAYTDGMGTERRNARLRRSVIIMSNTIECKDLIAFHPGAYVEETIDALNFTQSEFAEQLGVSGELISRIIAGRNGINTLTAGKLAKVTGVSRETWLNLQAQYDAEIVKLRNI